MGFPFLMYICTMAELIPKQHIKTYHTEHDVREYYVDALVRVVLITHLTNGKTYWETFELQPFLDKNQGTEIARLIMHHVWPM